MDQTNENTDVGNDGLSELKYKETIVTRRIDRDPEHRLWLQNLRDELDREPLFQAADKAFNKLRDRGCETHIVLGYLNRVCYKSGNVGALFVGGVNTKRISRNLRRSAHEFEKAARQIEEIRHKWWGMYGRVTEAGCYHFPEQLREMAQAVMRIDLKGYGEWNPQREAILDLLEHVRISTGRYHYAEVSTLINARLTRSAAERKQPWPDFKFDIDCLRMMVQRQKRRYEADIAKWRTKATATKSADETNQN